MSLNIANASIEWGDRTFQASEVSIANERTPLESGGGVFYFAGRQSSVVTARLMMRPSLASQFSNVMSRQPSLAPLHVTHGPNQHTIENATLVSVNYGAYRSPSSVALECVWRGSGMSFSVNPIPAADYTAEMVSGEDLGVVGDDGYISGNLSYTPVRPGTVTFQYGDMIVTDTRETFWQRVSASLLSGDVAPNTDNTIVYSSGYFEIHLNRAGMLINQHQMEYPHLMARYEYEISGAAHSAMRQNIRIGDISADEWIAEQQNIVREAALNSHEPPPVIQEGTARKITLPDD